MGKMCFEDLFTWETHEKKNVLTKIIPGIKLRLVTEAETFFKESQERNNQEAAFPQNHSQMA